jgi:hypothetical protein
MKKPYRFVGLVLLGLTAATVTGVIFKVRKKNAMKRLFQAADEGYETAHDIIYPETGRPNHPEHLKYGPYIPKYS